MKLTDSSIEIVNTHLSDWAQNLSQYQYSLFLSPEWIQAVSGPAATPLFLDFVKNGEVVAKASGLVCKGGGLKGNQLYFYAAPAFNQHTIHLYDTCHCALRDWACESGYSRLIIASYDQQTENVCKGKGFYNNFRYEYLVHLNEPDIQRSFATGFKKNYKKAEKLGTTFHSGRSHDVLSQMLVLMGVTRDIRTKKYKNSYNPFYLKCMDEVSLQRLLDNGLGKVYYTQNDTEINSVQYNLERDGRVYGLLMGSNNFAYKNGLPSFVDHNLIMGYKEKGFVYYNPGGGPVDEGGEGIEQYKKAMGGKKYIYAGTTTNFLTFPYRLLNPLLWVGRRLSSKSEKGIVGLLKRFV